MAAVEQGRAAWAPTPMQINYLKRALTQPGGKLPLFDEDGQSIDSRTIQACLAKGWAVRWFDNPLKPEWLVCRITESGRQVAQAFLQSGSVINEN